jgi:hypothetical protein
LNEQEEQHRIRIETEWDSKRLITLRQAIFESFVQGSLFQSYLKAYLTLNQPSSTSTGARYSWFSAIKDYYFGNTKSKTDTASSNKLSQSYNQIDDEFLGLINDSIENESLFRRDSLLAIIEFKIEKFGINLVNPATDCPIVELKFEQSKFSVEALPRYDSFLIEMSMQSFFLVDSYAKIKSEADSKNNCFFPIIIYPSYDAKLNEPVNFVSNKNRVDKTNTNEMTVFQLIYEHKPFAYMSDNQIKSDLVQYKANFTIKSCGLEIVYKLNFFEKLKSFLETVNEHYNQSLTCLVKTNMIF